MQQRIFIVTTYGVEEKDMLVLERIFSVTQGRTRTYVLQNTEEKNQTDIAIVNVSKKDAIRIWGTRHLDANGNSKCPTLLVGASKPKNTRYKYTPLPFFATRVLKTLDEITVEELKYTPELKIQDNEEILADEHDLVKTASNLSKNDVTSLIKRKQLEEQGKRKKVLVVDDSLPVRKALDMKLTLMKYDVTMASSGQQAIDILEQSQFDAIFLDVIMPGVDGYEVCKKIKRNKKKKHIPVIMLTSKSSPFDKVKGKLAGCDTYLTKPLEHEHFQKVVVGYVG